MRRSPADSTNRSLAAFGKLRHIRWMRSWMIGWVDPFKIWLDALPAWDGEDRIDFWLGHAATRVLGGDPHPEVPDEAPPVRGVQPTVPCSGSVGSAGRSMTTTRSTERKRESNDR